MSLFQSNKILVENFKYLSALIMCQIREAYDLAYPINAQHIIRNFLAFIAKSIMSSISPPAPQLSP
jgi:hypothetical protein